MTLIGGVRLTAGIIVIAVLLVLLERQPLSSRGYSIKQYPTYAEALRAGVAAGTLPTVTPRDATTINVCVEHNVGSVWASFRISGAFRVRSWRRLSLKELANIRVPCPGDLDWWDDSLCGRNAIGAGMEFYEYVGRNGKEYLVVDRAVGKVYYWRYRS